MKLPSFKFEKELWSKGCRFVVGIDEVGRGAWAGPVVAAAVIFPTPPQDHPSLREGWSYGETRTPGVRLRLRQTPGVKILKIRDSKQLLPHQREKLDKFIRQNCLAYSIAETNVKTINREGIAKATQRAFRKCLRQIEPQADFVLVDAFYIKYLAKKSQKPIIKGDQKSVSIASASIIAKVYRDNLMKKLHEKDERYHFDKHKGYGTKIHQEAIKKHGLSKHHRPGFVPENLTGRREHTEGVYPR